MTLRGSLRGDEVFVIDAVAQAFSGTWTPGENPPDAYLLVGSRSIAVEISTLAQQVTGDREFRPRLSDDKAAIAMVKELNAELSDAVPECETIGLILSAPILKMRQTKSELARLLREKLPDVNAFTTETKTEINRNVITIQRHSGRQGEKIWGLVANRHSSPDILANARVTLEERIVVKARKCAAFSGKCPLWLALLNDYWLADPDVYKDALSGISSAHSFEKILVVNLDGTIVSLLDI